MPVVTTVPQSVGTALPAVTTVPSVASATRIIAHVAEPPVGILSEIETEIEFSPPLVRVDLINDIAAELRGTQGIFELRGDERSATVIFDPGQITPGAIRVAFDRAGYPTRRIGTEISDPGLGAD
jgi:hypothetical protein